MKMAKMKSEKGKELKVLDSWFQNELPAAIQERNEKYVTKMELCELMKWKLSKGKFRPRLQQMVESNSEDLIISASKKAFKHLPNLKKAIEELTVLKAVGPATASAVLTAGAPDQAAFMADESMQALPGLMPLQYTLGFYLQYMDQIKQILKILQKETNQPGKLKLVWKHPQVSDVAHGPLVLKFCMLKSAFLMKSCIPDKTWTAHQVELTLWTFQFLKLNDPPLLIEAMEGSSKRKQENSNGDAKSGSEYKTVDCTGSAILIGHVEFHYGMAHFNPPQIQDNPSGWGPCAIPDQFKDLPYQPFSKGDRLGKVSDWTGATYQDKRHLGKYSSAFGGGASQYAYFHEEDENSFQLVDTSKIQKPQYQRGRRVFQQNKQRRERERRQQQNQANMQVLSKMQKSRERDRQRQLRKWQKQFGKQMQENRNKAPLKNRDASVQVKDSWEVVEEMDFPRLSKLSMPSVDDGEDLLKCGSMEYYDKQYDRVTTKNEKRMKRIDRVFHKVTTTDDPIIRQLAKSSGNVFATDAILATLMCCTRSVYSWDIIVQRVGNKLFFDKRDDSEFDLLSVSETATEPPQDEGNSINSPRNLALEATFINHNFSQQVLRMGDEKYSFEKSNPFVQNDDVSNIASVGYRYRKFELGNDIELICRCEHDAVLMGPNGELQFINIKTLNEWDSRYSGGVDWRSRLDNQRGAVLATELKNNSCKLAKWTVCSLLAGSDQIKFGYVSRVHHRDTSKHVILGTQQFKPTEFANQINLNMENAWGVLRCIVDTCMKLKEGKYLIMKDPNKPVMRIYDIPDDTFESEDDDDDEDDEDDDEDDEESSDDDDGKK